MAHGLLSAPQVLVVDGDARARALTAALLAALGARAMQAAGAADALRCLAARRFDAAVVEYELAEACGVVLVVQFRGFGNGRDLPALVVGSMTGAARERARAHTARVPGTAFLEKPLSGAGLAAALHGLLLPA